MNSIYAIVEAVGSTLTAFGFSLHYGAAGLLGVLIYEGLRIIKRGGLKRSLRGIGWWYLVIFGFNAIVAIFIASIGSSENYILALWLGFSVPSASGVMVQPRRTNPTKGAVRVDDISVGSEHQDSSFVSAVQRYYSGMTW